MCEDKRGSRALSWVSLNTSVVLRDASIVLRDAREPHSVYNVYKIIFATLDFSQFGFGFLSIQYEQNYVYQFGFFSTQCAQSLPLFPARLSGKRATFSP